MQKIIKPIIFIFLIIALLSITSCEHEHKYGDWYISKEPSCTEEGTQERACSICREKETRSIPSLGHTVAYSEQVDPTCTETGISEGTYCSVCKTKLSGYSLIEALGHDYGDWTITKPSTCLEEGAEERICSRCSSKETRSVAMVLEHDYKYGKCTICGYAPESGSFVLTEKGLYEVSSGKNIIIFVIDRFDISYYQDILKIDPTFFDKFDDFTFYSDNISTYSRTYPAITHMLTGEEFTGEFMAEVYFYNAYVNNDFLTTLEKNDYRIKVYTQDYYAYRNPNILSGTVYNMEYKDTDDYVEYAGENIDFYSGLKEFGVEIDDSKNSYIFIHVNGIHDPLNMDENGNYNEHANSRDVTKGCMNMIYDYIQELKVHEVYDDSLIIITGDHPRARDDFAYPTQPRITSLFVKYPNVSHGGLKISDAQVSHDMLIPTIIKEMNLGETTSLTYRDMETYEGNITRRHVFELGYGEAILVEYHIVGAGNDFNNWSIAKETEIGKLYK